MTLNPAQLHEHERVVAAAQTAPGRLLIWALASALLIGSDFALPSIAAVTLVMLFPHRRRLILSVCTLGLIVGYAFEYQGLDPDAPLVWLTSADLSHWLRAFILSAALVALLYGFVSVARRFQQLPTVVRKRPLLVFHALILLGLQLIGAVPWLAALSGYLELIPYLAWRIGYLLMLARRGKATGTQGKDHLFYLWPVWGGEDLPIGKGLDYLARHEAGDRQAFARSQLAGIKLLILAVLWTWVLQLMDAAVHGLNDNPFAAWLGGWTLGIPRLQDTLRGHGVSGIALAWLSLYLELIHVTLETAIWGHVIVGCLRLLGFNVFRNTYKPLLAESIIEYWGRFSHYFKELCVDFFFYPAFMRCAWAGPRLRLFIAIFAAAFVGNMYFHILEEPQLLIEGDPAALWARWGSRMVYCLLLALGVWVSMLRQQSQRATVVKTAVSSLTRIRRIAGVWTYYAVIHIWHIELNDVGPGERARFLAAALGL